MSAQLFEKLDDSLFDRSNSSSQQFFDGMRILRKNRETLTQTWFDRLADGWNNLRPQVPGAFRPRLVADGGVPVGGYAGSVGLALIDEMTLERSLAVESAIARGVTLCGMELPPLLHRLTLLRKGAAVHAEETPASPVMLVRTFAKSLEEVPDLPVEVLLVVFKLFDRIVVGGAGAVCQELNRILIQGGVAPHWSWSAPAPHRSEAMRPSPQQQAEATARSYRQRQEPSWLETVPARESDVQASVMPAQFADPGYPGVLGDFANVLQDFPPGTPEQTRLTASVRALLEHRRRARYAVLWPHSSGGAVSGQRADALGRGPSVPTPPPQALELETLMEVLASLPPPTLPTSWVDEPEERWDPDELKRELRKMLGGRTQRGEATGHEKDSRAPAQDIALGEHEDVIDMVAMMFSFIQQDQALPAAVQALLSRLQMPYLRLALVDADLFSSAEHPARALMDRLAEVGKGCTPGSPMLAEKMLRMHALVGRIVKNHAITRTFFEQEWTQFRSWADTIEQRAAVRERDQVTSLASAEPSAPIEEGADAQTGHVPAQQVSPSGRPDEDTADLHSHLHQIRLSATSRMRERLEGKTIPEGLRHILSILWVNHQVRIFEARGKRSYEAIWLDRQLDAVVGLLAAQPDAHARASLEQDWPDMERAWAGVLAEGPASEEARTRWIAMFRHWAEIRIGRAKADPSIRWNWLEGLAPARQQPAAHEAAASPDEKAFSAGADSSSSPSDGNSANTASPAAEPERESAFKIKPILPKPSPARWKVGDWIEFKDEATAENNAEVKDPKPNRAGRGKVSWIGSFTGKTILVKSDGTMWREESRVDLDDLLDRSVAFIIPRESLFDRSLQSMFKKLTDSVTTAPA